MAPQHKPCETSNMDKRKVTVIITVRNGERHIREAISSVLSQSFQDFELVVVDDGSIDRTLSEVLAFDDPRIRLIYKSHHYVDSLNTGLSEARGEYIAILDHDDLMMPNRLECQVKVMDTFKDLTVCGGRMAVFKDDDISNTRITALTAPGFVKHPLWRMLGGNFICNPTAMIRTSFLRERGLSYDPALPFAPDFKLWLDIAKVGGSFFLLDTPLTYYRISKSQMTQQSHKQQRENALAIRQMALEKLLSVTNWGKNAAGMAAWQADMQQMRTARLLTDDDLLHIYYMLFKNLYSVQQRM